MKGRIVIYFLLLFLKQKGFFFPHKQVSKQTNK